MADDKKKEKPAGWNLTPDEFIIVLILFLSLLGGLLPFLLGSFGPNGLSFFGFKLSRILDFIKSHTFFFKALGFSIAGAGVIGTIWLNKMADALAVAQKATLYLVGVADAAIDKNPAQNPLKTKWEKILTLSESQNQSDWRLAIIEADIILDDLLKKLQLPGDTMGDKLKAVEPSDFTTIDAAWEAHKMRNMIAHEGTDFLINQREIRRIISLYESVFKEFQLI